MSILNSYIKQPADDLDYDFDYSEFLGSLDTIESATFDRTPTGLTLVTGVVEPTFTKVWISDGVAGVSYKVTCTITTTHGRVKQDEIRIRVREY